MNGWMIGFCLWYAVGVIATLFQKDTNKTQLFLGCAISLTLLYMGGAFS